MWGFPRPTVHREISETFHLASSPSCPWVEVYSTSTGRITDALTKDFSLSQDRAVTELDCIEKMTDEQASNAGSDKIHSDDSRLF